MGKRFLKATILLSVPAVLALGLAIHSPAQATVKPTADKCKVEWVPT